MNKNASLEPQKSKKARSGNASCVVVAYNFRSRHNVGSILRTSDAVGVSKLIFVGTTPAPIDRFGREDDAISKTALGADKTVSWKYAKTITPIITKLKKEGYTIVALEQDKTSIDYKKFTVSKHKKFALILGEEAEGIPKNILSKVDIICEIPMKGQKESLNVSVAYGVAIYRMLKI